MKVAIVVFDGTRALDVAVAMDVFAAANACLPPADRYRVTVVGAQAGSVRCDNGMRLAVDASYRHLPDRADMEIIACDAEPGPPPPAPDFLAWLRASAARRPPVSAASCVALVREHWGSALGGRIVAQLGAALRRQAPPSAGEATARGDDSVFIARNRRYVMAHLDERLSVSQLAAAMAVSRRTLSRTFARVAGLTPSAFIEQVRIDSSRALLEETDLPMKTVAYRCGFRSASRMRTAFARRLVTTPQEYRRQVRSGEGIRVERA